MDDTMNIKKKRVMTYFIEATEKLILEDGVDGLSIRKIATEAGYNSATLYNYFEDLEHLALYASVRLLREYVSALSREITEGMNALERYRSIYVTFNYYSFRSPEIFHNMFFGKYSHKLSQVISQYYELFPDELQGHGDSVRMMLTQWNMYLRDEPIMRELVKEGFVDPGNAETTLVLISRTHQSYLYEAWVGDDRIDPDEQSDRFIKAFNYIMQAARFKFI